MKKIKGTTRLEEKILALEALQSEQKFQVFEQFVKTVESLKPANIIKETLKEVSPFFIDNIIGVAVGLASGYVSKKIIVGDSVNKFKRLFGYVLQFGVSNMIAQNPEVIQSFSRFLHNIFSKKEKEQA
jgi:hypothetical protein